MSLLARTTSRCRIKWLIFYRCGFVFLSFFLSFFFFSTPNLWGHWTDLNQTWTQNLVRTARAFSPRGGGKNCFYLDRLWTLTEHIFATEHDINNQKVTCQSSGTSPYAPKFGKLVQKRLRTVGEFLTPPPIFAWGNTVSLTAAWTLYNRQQANFGTCYVVARAYNLEQQNAGGLMLGFVMHLVLYSS